MKESRLVFLGSGSVGKSSLILQFLQEKYSTNYQPTVEDCYRNTLQLPSGMYHALEILDTAGSHNFPAMRELSIRSGRAFVVVFAVNDRETFFEAQRILELITKIKGSSEVPVIVVGNKVDLEGKRIVSKTEIEEWIDKFGDTNAYIETSAKLNINVSQLFRKLLVKAYGLGEKEMEEKLTVRSRIRSLGNILEVVRRKSSSSNATNSVTKDGVNPRRKASLSPGRSGRSSFILCGGSSSMICSRNKTTSCQNLGDKYYIPNHHQKCIIL